MRNVALIIVALLLTSDMPAMAGGSGMANSADAKPRSDTQVQPGQAPARNFKAPYPFTADELWKKILRVIAMPDGHVTRGQVEQIFGMKLALQEKATERNRFSIYAVQREIDWYFDVAFWEMSARQSSFYFSWGFPPGVISGGFALPPPGMCIDESKVMSGIAARGWKLVEQVRNTDIPDYNRYRKGKMGAIEVGFTRPDKCLLYLSVTAEDNHPY